jgi:tRNA threonylcarbamoyladenosine biosynthesis protein TsaE
MERVFCKNKSENPKVAKLILNTLKDKKCNLLLLKGNLGAGKTTLTGEIAKLLNSKNRSSSPTFVLQKIYHLEKNMWNFERIFHIDLYRLNSKDDIDEINLFEDLYNLKNLYIVEWPENYGLWPEIRVNVNIDKNGDSRIFNIH